MYHDAQFAVLYRCAGAGRDALRCATGRGHLQVYARTSELSGNDTALYEALVTQYAPSAGLDPLSVERVQQTCRSQSIHVQVELV